NRLIELTNQLLDFRKTETRGFSLNFVKTNISTILEDTYNSFKVLAEPKNLLYQLTLPEKEIYAYVDTDAFSKILSNLFNNAVKYARSEIKVGLAPANEERTFQITIQNDGHLIPIEMKEQIFEPFFRMKETEKQAGTGIGLSISKALAELHKGKLELSDSNNRMNTFILSLPVHQEIEFDLHRL
ncbi:MAG: sensor histidine kinase, partial [Chitinophagales bacterium]